jgi:hypothetical protein
MILIRNQKHEMELVKTQKDGLRLMNIFILINENKINLITDQMIISNRILFWKKKQSVSEKLDWLVYNKKNNHANVLHEKHLLILLVIVSNRQNYYNLKHFSVVLPFWLLIGNI